MSIVISLQESATIAHAGALHQRLMAALPSGEALSIDGSRVTEIDAAILQLLVSLWQTTAARKIACGWAGASDSLQAAAHLIGVAEMLGLR